MNLKEMRAKVLQELEHVPKHPKGCQGDLRMVYFAARMHSLGKKAEEEKTAADVLHECIKLLRKHHPGIEFQYDTKFFKPRKKGT